MKEIIIKDLSFSYKNKKVFSKVNLAIDDGAFVHILGPSGSGKSTFAKILVGILPFEGYICLNRTVLNKKNMDSLHRRVAYVSENFYEDFLFRTVLEEIIYTLENMGYRKSDIAQHISSIVSLFHFEQDLNKNLNDLTLSKKAMVKLASVLICCPKILILDSLFSYMDFDDKKRAVRILKKYNKDKKLIILHITNNAEDILLGTDVLLLYHESCLFYCKKDEIYDHEKEFHSANVSLPFMVSLSKKLSYYSLVQSSILNQKEMVNVLWK